MKDILKRTLETIQMELESGYELDKSYDLVDELVSVYGRSDLVRRLYEDIDEETDWKVVVELFSFLFWETSDVYTQLVAMVDKWLKECNDIRKVTIALNVFWYPFTDKDTMVKVLTKVAQTYPEVAERCNSLIDSRNSENV